VSATAAGSAVEHLIVQGPGIGRPFVERLARDAGAAALEELDGGAYRLRAIGSRAGLAEACAAAGFDAAFVPDTRRLDELRLAAFDMDSTLITIECIDELADLAGVRAEVAAITAAAMRGELDYRQSLRQRVALLAGLEQGMLERVYDERLRLSPGAERLIERLRGRGVRTLLVSGGFTFFTERLQARLRIDWTCSSTLAIAQGRLTGEVTGEIVDAAVKARALRERIAELGLERHQVLAIGDGANDLAMMAEAGVSVAWRAKPVVRARATHALDASGLDAVLNLYL
jgi:phosphoserine phosphatase